VLGDESSAAGKEPAETICLNSIGFLPDGEKRATILSADEEFLIRDVPTGKEVLRGRMESVASDDQRAQDFHIANFSSVSREGRYRLELPGGEKSCEFVIRRPLYTDALHLCVRAMYLWRCGAEVSGKHDGHEFHHAACHLEDAYLDHAGGPAGQRIDGVGGWHDAGDYNKYTVNAAFTVGMMLQAWEHFPEPLAQLKLNIPESDNDIPDYLDEVRWELDWLLKMQADDGRVYHKLSTHRCLAAAEKSYAVLQDHPEDHRPDQSAFSTGAYHAPDRDDRWWAAAELWETTGDAKYLRDFAKRVLSDESEPGDAKSVIDFDWDWSNARNLGSFTYALSKRPGRDAAVLKRVRTDVIKTADRIVEATRRHPYGRPLNSRYYWGCNGTVARQSMNLHAAHRLTEEPRYQAAMLAALDHLFGRNPFGRSYVTGLGHRPPMFPHDRRSGGDSVDAPWPGYLVGGPWPKPTDWYDDQEDYRTNEIAINWNGALIYALAAVVEPQAIDASKATGRRGASDDALAVE
jgi:endoglucanase